MEFHLCLKGNKNVICSQKLEYFFPLFALMGHHLAHHSLNTVTDVLSDLWRVRERTGPFSLNKGTANELHIPVFCLYVYLWVGWFLCFSLGTLEIFAALFHCTWLLFFLCCYSYKDLSKVDLFSVQLYAEATQSLVSLLGAMFNDKHSCLCMSSVLTQTVFSFVGNTQFALCYEFTCDFYWLKDAVVCQ